MPRLNQTGPMGKGPMTGRIMGKCCNAEVDNNESSEDNATKNPEVNENGNGLGRGQGQGGGRGMGRNQNNN